MYCTALCAVLYYVLYCIMYCTVLYIQFSAPIRWYLYCIIFTVLRPNTLIRVLYYIYSSPPQYHDTCTVLYLQFSAPIPWYVYCIIFTVLRPNTLIRVLILQYPPCIFLTMWQMSYYDYLLHSETSWPFFLVSSAATGSATAVPRQMSQKVTFLALRYVEEVTWESSDENSTPGNVRGPSVAHTTHASMHMVFAMPNPPWWLLLDHWNTYIRYGINIEKQHCIYVHWWHTNKEWN